MDITQQGPWMIRRPYKWSEYRTLKWTPTGQTLVLKNRSILSLSRNLAPYQLKLILVNISLLDISKLSSMPPPTHIISLWIIVLTTDLEKQINVYWRIPLSHYSGMGTNTFFFFLFCWGGGPFESTAIIQPEVIMLILIQKSNLLWLSCKIQPLCL